MGSPFALEATTADQTDVVVAKQGVNDDLLLAYTDHRNGNPDPYGERYVSPIASFLAAPTSGNPPLTVVFTDTSTTPNTLDAWLWSFGDGETSTQQSPTHTYSLAGAYFVNLTVQSGAEADRSFVTQISVYNAPPASPVVITYTYDGLYRLARAEYSSGELLAYQHDATGNRLVYTETLSSQVVTTYTYDAANRLTTAKASDEANTWYYTSDANGNLVEVTPNDTTPDFGALRYSYDPAHRLSRVEYYDGSTYQMQARMVYDGAGQRLSVTAWQGGLSLSARYVVDSARNGAVLAATAGGQTTYYLYGYAVIAEYTSAWAYYLKDGLATVRQLTDAAAEVTFARTPDPFGQILSQVGGDNLAWGYFGGLLDAATGLTYLGKGLYYDPATGRFLTPGGAGPNPYVPASRGDPLGAMLGPVLVLVLIARRRRTKDRSGYWFTMLMLLAGVGVAVVACGGPNPEGPTPEPTVPSPLPTPPADLPVKIPSKWPPEEPVILPDLTNSQYQTDHQTILNSTIRFWMRTSIDCPDTGNVMISNVPSTGTYMGNGHIYTHRHASLEQLPQNKDRAAITKILKWDGTVILDTADGFSLRDVKIDDSGRGHLDIQLPDWADQVIFQQNGVQPAVRGDPSQIVPLAADSVVSVPYWNGSRYEVMNLLYVADATAENGGEPTGHFLVSPPAILLTGGDSGGGIWFRGAVIGNIFSTDIVGVVFPTFPDVGTLYYQGIIGSWIPTRFTFAP